MTRATRCDEHLGAVAHLVVLVGRRLSQGIPHLGETVVGIVGEDRRKVPGVGDLGCPAYQWTFAVSCSLPVYS